MNITIPAFLSGGGVSSVLYRPMIFNNPLPPSPFDIAGSLATASSASGGSKSSGSRSSGSADELSAKDIVLMASKLDLLPSDSAAVNQQLTKLLQLNQSGLIDSNLLATKYMLTLTLIDTAKQNKKAYDQTHASLAKDGSISEIAINADGRIVVQNKEGNIQLISADDYNLHRDSYLALTNSEVLNMRAYSDKFLLDPTLIAVTENGISMKTIQDLALKAISKIGTAENESNKYESRKSKSLEEGLQAVTQAGDLGESFAQSGIGGLFKRKVLTKSQAQAAQQCLSYIWNTMPENAKTLLKVKGGSLEKAVGILADLINMTLDSTQHDEDTWVLDENGLPPGYAAKAKLVADMKGKSGGGGSETGEPDADIYTNIQRGVGGSKGTLEMMNKDGQVVSISGTSYPYIGEIPEEGTLQDLMTANKSGLNRLTSGSGNNMAVTFGDLVLDSSQTSLIAFVNDLQAIRVILPTIVDPDTKKVVPDLKFIEEHKDLIDAINDKGLDDPEVKKQLESLGLINEFTGKINLDAWKPYLCIDGLASSRTVKEGVLAQEVKGDTAKPWIELFERSVARTKEQNKGVASNFDFDNFTWYNPLDWFGNYDRLYKGTIFLPITENPLLTKVASTNIKESYAKDYEQLYQRAQISKYAQPTSSNLLML